MGCGVCNKIMLPLRTGHKQDREFPSSWLIVSAQLCFERICGIGGVDNLFAPQGVIQEAQQLAADAFGQRTYVVFGQWVHLWSGGNPGYLCHW